VKASAQYQFLKKPKWAPPSKIFGPVWSLLYFIIIITFGYVAYLSVTDAISLAILLPFLLNLIFNLLYTPLQFRWRKFVLATIDVVLVVVTLVWAMWVIYPIASWVMYLNIPYLVWVCFATVLQISVTALNTKNTKTVVE
jgi:benzodiazapine receptor